MPPGQRSATGTPSSGRKAILAMGTGVTLAAMRQQTGANDLLFRRFEPNDQAAVQALILAGLRDRWGSLDPSLNRDLDDIASIYGSGVTLTAWRGDCLVATGTLVPRGPDVAEVLRMSTAAGSRRLGIATRLLTDLLAAARARGVQVVVLETSAAWRCTVAVRAARLRSRPGGGRGVLPGRVLPTAPQQQVVAAICPAALVPLVLRLPGRHRRASWRRLREAAAPPVEDRPSGRSAAAGLR